jgi:hypothetical protein
VVPPSAGSLPPSIVRMCMLYVRFCLFVVCIPYFEHLFCDVYCPLFPILCDKNKGTEDKNCWVSRRYTTRDATQSRDACHLILFSNPHTRVGTTCNHDGRMPTDRPGSRPHTRRNLLLQEEICYCVLRRYNAVLPLGDPKLLPTSAVTKLTLDEEGELCVTRAQNDRPTALQPVTR